jgi:Ala-tRNA(Pro) deacylase
MPISHVKQFLDDHGVKYVLVKHSPAYTSQEIAAEAHVPGRNFAKTVTVKLDGRLAMAVLPATDQVDLERLAQSTGAQSAELATEEEFSGRFPGCEVGAMPPFGNLFDMEVFVSPHLPEAEEIAFNAGSHTEVMRLAYSDFAHLVNPAVVYM